jgi:hypothetical protein
MRLLWHYVKVWFFVGLAVTAYAAVAASALCFWTRLTPPVAVSLISAGVAVVTGLIALTKDGIAGVINSPKLKIRFFPYDKRDCHTTAFRNTQTGAIVAKTHYFRVRIENIGWRTAEEVEVTLEEVNRFNDGKWILDTDFMPLRLLWSHWREKRYEIAIPAAAYRHCDLGFVLDPASISPPLPPVEADQVVFWFDVFLRPNTGRTSLLPGRYQILLSAFGKNARRASLKIKLEWKGLWRDDIDELYQEGLILTKGFESA